MKVRGLLTIGVSLLAAASCLAEEGDAEVEARKTALELAGAFSNDGFKMRDGHWAGQIKPKERALIAVNLYAGNEYWFSAGTGEEVKKMSVEVYDETGRQMVSEKYDAGATAAAGFSPRSSGQYYVSIELLEGDANTFCLVYSYK